ncbi:hypothetical protein NBRC111894_2541 [Sporolactobacillus inulinus]|uniref:Uncharacterized protein n=1 Tax=Sporolactobacillus inulinus TaxID=2078 RepID=A0A4Y1ZD19_9BACL|nr:hypothetical protein [Sporolactobacillus inulinus]GAY76987.1 hypothetical protein NBRC111894_2541 [Sporolactobacillus inulinus]
MIHVTQLLHHILNELDRNENAFRLLPDGFRESLRIQLSGLMTYHERVLLKFDGKIRRKRHEEQARKDYKQSATLARLFFSHLSTEKPMNGWICFRSFQPSLITISISNILIA